MILLSMILYAGTWGLSAMSRLGPSGLDFDNMPEDQKRVLNNLPDMLYHGLPRRSGLAKMGVPRRSFRAKPGVNTGPAVLMRMNAVPRSIATGLGDKYAAAAKESADLHSVCSVSVEVVDDQQASMQNLSQPPFEGRRTGAADREAALGFDKAR